ncbi:hypothetical protein [Bradyrhizobium sp.]
MTYVNRWLDVVRSGHPVWQGHSPERPKEMRDHLARLKAQGVEAID